VLEEEFRKAYGTYTGIWLVPRITKEYDFNNLRKVDEDQPPNQSVQSKRAVFKPYTGVGEVYIPAP